MQTKSGAKVCAGLLISSPKQYVYVQYACSLHEDDSLSRKFCRRKIKFAVERSGVRCVIRESKRESRYG